MKKIAAIIGVAAGIILIIVGLATEVPGRGIGKYHGEEAVTEYINGDAYNYIIESSLRAGEISGAQASKAVFITGGCILACLSAIAFAWPATAGPQTQYVAAPTAPMATAEPASAAPATIGTAAPCAAPAPAAPPAGAPAPQPAGDQPLSQ